MKKLTAIVLCLLLTVMLAIPALAAQTTVMTISAEVSAAKPGDEIEFKISMSGGEKCSSFGLILEYDSNAFEVVEGECTLKDALFAVFDEDKGLACIFSEAQALSGEVGSFILRVKAGAPSGTFEISGKSSVKNGGDAVESEVEAVKVTISGGSGTQNAGASGSQNSSSSNSQGGSASNSQNGSASGSQSSSSAGKQEAPENLIATQPDAVETIAAEETPEVTEAVTEELPAAEEEPQAPSEELLIMPAPETETEENNKDMLVIAVISAVVLLVAVIVILVLKKRIR